MTRVLDPIRLDREIERIDELDLAVKDAIRTGCLRATHKEVPDEVIEQIQDDLERTVQTMRSARLMDDGDMWERCLDIIKDYAEEYIERKWEECLK